MAALAVIGALALVEAPLQRPEMATLAAVLGAERVPVWLNKPIPALEHRKPLDVIAAGGYEQVSRVVAELESPTFG